MKLSQQAREKLASAFYNEFKRRNPELKGIPNDVLKDASIIPGNIDWSMDDVSLLSDLYAWFFPEGYWPFTGLDLSKIYDCILTGHPLDDPHIPDDALI